MSGISYRAFFILFIMQSRILEKMALTVLRLCFGICCSRHILGRIFPTLY